MGISKDEKELLESVENDEWMTVSDIESELKKFQAYAKASQKKIKE